MFSIDHLNNLREYELSLLLPYLVNQGRILEIGGGSGIQAKRLSEAGCDIVSVDVGESGYANDRVFPVIDYDGRNLPLADDSFDVIFSSNVLEHIPSLDQFHHELKRVLKPGGYCIHIMPTGAWRFWTTVANYTEMLQRLFMAAGDSLPKSLNIRTELQRALNGIRNAAGILRTYVIPPRHGEEGNAWTEIYTFSKPYWVRHFHENDYEIMEVTPMKLFYTGHMVLGNRWSMKGRTGFSSTLGSACVLYKVKPGRKDI